MYICTFVVHTMIALLNDAQITRVAEGKSSIFLLFKPVPCCLQPWRSLSACRSLLRHHRAHLETSKKRPLKLIPVDSHLLHHARYEIIGNEWTQPLA